jgi:hypothetical protein
LVVDMFRNHGFIRVEALLHPAAGVPLLDRYLVTVRNDLCAESAIQAIHGTRWGQGECDVYSLTRAIEFQDDVGGSYEGREIQRPGTSNQAGNISSDWMRQQALDIYIRSQYRKAERDLEYKVLHEARRTAVPEIHSPPGPRYHTPTVPLSSLSDEEQGFALFPEMYAEARQTAIPEIHLPRRSSYHIPNVSLSSLSDEERQEELNQLLGGPRRFTISRVPSRSPIQVKKYTRRLQVVEQQVIDEAPTSTERSEPTEQSYPRSPTVSEAETVIWRPELQQGAFGQNTRAVNDAVEAAADFWLTLLPESTAELPALLTPGGRNGNGHCASGFSTRSHRGE